jgi:type II secretory pathway pseudopilin PulG
MNIYRYLNFQKVIRVICFILPITILLSFFSLNFNSVLAENKEQYAKVIGSNVKLYRTLSGDEDYSNVFFTIPQSYFVLLNPCDDENYYAATYIDIPGYVKKNEVQCVKGTPVTPFANNISFRIFVPGGVDLRSSPTQSEGLNSVANLQYLETNIKYYGSIDGEEAISYKSTKWYFCKYYKNGIAQSGYVYSAFCDLLTTFSENTEMLEYIDEPEFEVLDTSNNPPNELSSLPDVTQIIIIVAVSLPCIFIIYLLFKPTKITARVMENAELNQKKAKKKNKHKDYYEYDE